VPDEPTRGYHETMTGAWLRIIHATMQICGPANSSEAFVDSSRNCEKRKIATVLFAGADHVCAAKREFVEPDLAPLPRPNR